MNLLAERLTLLLSHLNLSLRVEPLAFGYLHLLPRGFNSLLRDPDPLAKLPEAERDAWRRLWADVAALLHRAADRK